MRLPPVSVAIVLLLLVTFARLPTAYAASDVPLEWHISCFAYRDMNRNSVYDMADRPFSGLRVELERPRGSKVTRYSNVDGFANFKTRFDATDKDIYEPGIHTVKTFMPTGWHVVSKDSIQQLNVIRREDAGGGLVVAETCNPIGVQSKLLINGSVAITEGMLSTNISITAENERGESFNIPVSQNGSFRLNATPGKWGFRFTNLKTKFSTLRAVDVTNTAVVLSTINLQPLNVDALTTSVETVNFDGLTTSDTLFEIPSGYGGLNWKNLIAVHNRFYMGYGYINGTITGEYAAYSSSGYPFTAWSPELFDFVGVFVNVTWPRGEEARIFVRAWRNDSLAYEDSFVGYTAGSIFFDANYIAINKLEVSHGVYERIVIDDFSYRR